MLLLSLSLSAGARPYIPQLRDVPVDQLLQKYAQIVAREPKNAQNHYVYGRLNCIAYATHTTTFQVSQGNQLPWFGPMDPGFPPAPPPAPKSGLKFLQKAVEEYRKAVALDPKSQPARLGYGWCLEQAGRKAEAREQYRLVFAQAATMDLEGNGPHFGISLTEESGRYLLGLLDPKQDAAEIAEVQSKLERARKIPRAVTPVLIPLKRGLSFEQLVDRRARVVFDLDATGLKRRWQWPTRQAGWLVYLKQRPAVTSGLQMLGSRTFWIFWENGYQAMAALDRDEDGWLSKDELSPLKLWCDDGDGVCLPAELRDLRTLGIEALNTKGQAHSAGFWSPAGIRYQDGSMGPSYDWVPESR
ncbi:MAG: tetratricopeptide repeat protein [Vulcanimicrobiota bacterium]